MHFGQYVFTQMTSFLPKRYFERLVAKSSDRTKNWTPSHWSQLLVLMFGQLMGCQGLRELTDITTAHGKKSFHLGFGIALLYKYRWQVELFFESWAVLCSPRMTLRNFSFRLKKTTKQMMDSLRLILNSININ